MDIDSTELLTIFGTIVGVAWAWLKGTEWYKERLSRRHRFGLRILERAVAKIFRDYVRERKVAGTFTADDEVHANTNALGTARGLALREGRSLPSLLGYEPDALDIDAAVGRVKLRQPTTP